MEFELRIRGSQSELEQVMRAIGSTDASLTPKASSETSLTVESLSDFLSVLKESGRRVFWQITEASLPGKEGVHDEELLESLQSTSQEPSTMQHVWGEVGGIGRRWVAKFGTGSPFKKDHAGRYRIPSELADEIAALKGKLDPNYV